MTLPIATETIVEMYRDQMMTVQEIASALGVSHQLVWYRLDKAGVGVKRTNKHHLYRDLKPHLPVLKAMTVEMCKRRKKMAEFVVDPRQPEELRAKMAESLVRLNREITAMEILIRK